jgi:hypothetical protein
MSMIALGQAEGRDGCPQPSAVSQAGRCGQAEAARWDSTPYLLRLAKRKTEAPAVRLPRSRHTRSVLECGSLHRFGRHYKIRSRSKAAGTAALQDAAAIFASNKNCAMPVSTHLLLVNNKNRPQHEPHIFQLISFTNRHSQWCQFFNFQTDSFLSMTRSFEFIVFSSPVIWQQSPKWNYHSLYC